MTTHSPSQVTPSSQEETVVKMQQETVLKEPTFHQLTDSWTLWGHLPHDTDWSVRSYKKIFHITSVEEAVCITESLPEVLVQNCMLFLMRDGIVPMWEDKQNRNGGCFSYKVVNKNVYEVWRDLSYSIMGETASNNKSFSENINGITISPKKNFCIVKIWMKTCSFQNPALVTVESKGLTSNGCLFKKHSPEF